MVLIISYAAYEHVLFNTRHAMYKEMLGMFESYVVPSMDMFEYQWNGFGFCKAIQDTAPWYMPKQIEKYPELMEYKPDNMYDRHWWFNPYLQEERIEILKQIISSC